MTDKIHVTVPTVSLDQAVGVGRAILVKAVM